MIKWRVELLANHAISELRRVRALRGAAAELIWHEWSGQSFDL